MEKNTCLGESYPTHFLYVYLEKKCGQIGVWNRKNLEENYLFLVEEKIKISKTLAELNFLIKITRLHE